MRLYLFLAGFILAMGCQPAAGPDKEPLNQDQPKWIRGQIAMPSSSTGNGLIMVAHNDHAYWIPYGETGFSHSDTVYFQLGNTNLGENATLVFAHSLTNSIQADMCTDDEVFNLIKGKAFFPHDLYTDHPASGSGQHKPGHIISIVSGQDVRKRVTISWEYEGKIESQTEEFALVNFAFTNLDTTQFYVRVAAIAALSDTTKNYYPEFFGTLIGSKLVLRSYSVEHSHWGHPAPVTLTAN